jgi:hypothetical protein
VTFPYELFVFDLDGTLLSQDSSLPQEAVEFLRALSGRAKVTLATGRSLTSTRPYLRRLGITTPAILYNGAVVIDPVSERPLFVRRIPKELALKVLEVVRGFPVHPQVYRKVEDPWIDVAKIATPIQRFLAKEGLPAREVGDLRKAVFQAPIKFLIVGEPGVLPALEQALRSEVPEVSVVRSETEYVEVLPPGVSKGEALAWLCNRLGVPPSRVVAVGDQRNDLTMIELAGLGVAMAHAPEEVRTRADLVVSTIEELAAQLDI